MSVCALIKHSSAHAPALSEHSSVCTKEEPLRRTEYESVSGDLATNIIYRVTFQCTRELGPVIRKHLYQTNKTLRQGLCFSGLIRATSGDNINLLGEGFVFSSVAPCCLLYTIVLMGGTGVVEPDGWFVSCVAVFMKMEDICVHWIPQTMLRTRATTIHCSVSPSWGTNIEVY